MKVVLSAVVLALTLLCGVQGEPQCLSEDGDENFYNNYDYDDDYLDVAPSCGCQLVDDDKKSLINITLDFVGTATAMAEDDLVEYTYSPCSGDTPCKENETAICRHEGPFDPESIGSLNNVNYTVNNATHVNVSAKYIGEHGTSVVHLVCDEGSKKENGTFKFLYRIKSERMYYFELSYHEFCLPPTPTPTTSTKTSTKPTTTTTKTTKPTTTTKHTSSTTTKSTSTTTTTKTKPAGPTSQPSENKDDKDRKVVLGVVLSIVGAIIVGVIMAIVVYFLWKRKRGASYEKIPTM